MERSGTDYRRRSGENGDFGARHVGRCMSDGLYFAFVSLVFAILLACAVTCCVVFVETRSHCLNYGQVNQEWYDNTCQVYMQQHHLDSIMAKNDVLLSKPDVDRIIRGQQLVMERQDALAQDLRQETNNVINKMNGWLAFWLGIMAILGVFVPIALQFKLYRERRDEDEERRIRFESTIDEFKRKSFSVEYTTLVRNFQYVFDRPEFSTREIKSRILENIWKEIVEKLYGFISGYCDQKSDGKKMQDLTLALVLVLNVLSMIRTFTPRKVRRVSVFIDETVAIINQINNPSSGTEDICHRLGDYYGRLRTLRITW